MATLRTRCTQCGKGLTIKKPELVGKKVACPSCGQPFVVRPVSSSKSTPPKPRPAKDAVLEAEIVDAEEVAPPSAGDDDWLDALDSLPPTTPVAAPPAEAPRRRKSRKKKSSSGKSKKGSSLRDGEGEFPLWMHRLLMMGSGFVGGLIATLMWAGVIYEFDMPSSWMAILVGVFVGTAVRFGASKWDYGWWPAITASLIAFVTIFAGKIAGFFLLERQFAAEMEQHNAAYLAMLKHEDYPVSQIAMEMELERFQQGDFEMSMEDLEAMEDYEDFDDPDWSEIYNPERFPEQYPHTWEPAQQRWAQMPDDEKNERRKAIDAEIALLESGNWDEFDASVGGLEVISVWDFICSIIAIIAAFRIAAGWADDDD